MSKRIEKQLQSFKYKGEPLKITAGTLILICLCILLLIISTFTQITFIHPFIPMKIYSFFYHISGGTENLYSIVKTYRYIPQIPMIFFIIALLGRKFGITAILGYILLGMFFPVFALGGGISYIFEYGFGYILAFIPAVFFSGTLLKIKSDFLRVILLAMLGVLAIHILGVLYTLFIATLRHTPMDFIMNMISSQSGFVRIAYDVFFSTIAIYFGKMARKVFWIIMC